MKSLLLTPWIFVWFGNICNMNVTIGLTEQPAAEFEIVHQVEIKGT